MFRSPKSRLREALARHLPVESEKSPERRITLLAVRLHGYEELARTLELEPMQELTSAYLAAVSKVTAAHGGSMDALGTRVLVSFENPVPALRGARELLAAPGGPPPFAAHAARYPVPLRLALGMATGFCRSGELGSEQRAWIQWVGAAAVEAEALCSRATPGQLLLDPATRELAQASAPDLLP